jgi:hypothetical protein
MEGTHRKVGSRPFMPDPTLTCLCSALLGHIAKLGSNYPSETAKSQIC